MRGRKFSAVALLAGAVILGSGTSASADPAPSGFGVDNAAPVAVNTANQLVGSIGGPFAVVNIACPAPWASQGFDILQNYAACATSPITG